jgi:hypothetical protein
MARPYEGAPLATADISEEIWMAAEEIRTIQSAVPSHQRPATTERPVGSVGAAQSS